MIKFRKGIGIFWITFFGYGFGVIDCKGYEYHFKCLLFGKYFITFIKPLKYK